MNRWPSILRKGTNLINEHDITKMAMHQRARKGIGYLPKKPPFYKNDRTR